MPRCKKRPLTGPGTGAQSGYSLVELLVAMTLTTLVAGGLMALFARQLDFYQTEDNLRDARIAARAAMNVLTTDLRMVETGGGVIAANESSIEVRVPVAFGIICNATAASVVVSFMPVAPEAIALAELSGWAWRNADNDAWTYEEGAVTRSPVGAAACTANDVTILDGGAAIRVAPGVDGLAAGTPLMLYQRVRFHFDPSITLPGPRALFRTVVATGQTDELSAPFAPEARFRFFAGWSDPQDSPPADLTTLRGVEVDLVAESPGRSRAGERERFTVVAAIYFRNRID